MEVFDVPNRSTCIVKRQRTSTPLQPLVLMNDPQFMEAARVMAVRMQREVEKDLDGQINHGFQLAIGRKPDEREMEVFKSLYDQELKRFQGDIKAARDLLAVGEYTAGGNYPQAKTAALTIVASLMFNHDAFYTKR